MVTISNLDNRWLIGNIGAVLFDKDGTFIDSHFYWGTIISARSLAICRAYSLSEEHLEDIERSMGFCRSIRKLLPEGPIALVSREEVISHVISHLAAIGVSANFEDLAQLFIQVHQDILHCLDECVRPIPEATPLFESLHQVGVLMAVVTTDSTDNTWATLDKLGLTRFFSSVIGKESCKRPKETGDPARIALQELGVSGESAICIGDAPMDIQMAKNSGCKACIGVATGQISLDKLFRFTPYAVSSLAELRVAV